TQRGIEMIDVPDSEYDSLGCNILAIAPRMAVMAAGNPVTRSRIEAAGCKVFEFDGSEICLPGSGGPTCLTRPLLRGYAAEEGSFQKIASGLTGEPVPPSTGSGAKVTMNS